MGVYTIPKNKDLNIPIGDDYAGAELTLTVSPGTGTFHSNLRDCTGAIHPFVVNEVSPTVVELSMPSSTTEKIAKGRFTHSLLFNETSSGKDRTISVGGGTARLYPTSGLNP